MSEKFVLKDTINLNTGKKTNLGICNQKLVKARSFGYGSSEDFFFQILWGGG